MDATVRTGLVFVVPVECDSIVGAGNVVMDFWFPLWVAQIDELASFFDSPADATYTATRTCRLGGEYPQPVQIILDLVAASLMLVIVLRYT